MKPLIIYHDNCADGFGAAFAAWCRFGDEAEYMPMKYGADISPDMVAEKARGRNVYILDFSFSRQITDHIFAAAAKIVWLDHHKTAFEMWCGEYHKGIYREGGFGERDDSNEDTGVFFRLNDNKSGALLAWEYFHPGTPAPLMFLHIDDYDRWQFKMQGTKEYIKAIWARGPWTFALWAHMWTNDKVHDLYLEGEAILRAHDMNVQAVVKGGTRPCNITLWKPADDGIESAARPGLAANCPTHLTSDVGHELATRSGTYGLLWYMDKSGVINCSLRSNGDYDVSAIAKMFGGGGHRNAAGFQTDSETLLRWLK